MIAGVLDGIQSVLNPQGTESAIIAEMAWVLSLRRLRAALRIEVTGEQW